MVAFAIALTFVYLRLVLLTGPTH